MDFPRGSTERLLTPRAPVITMLMSRPPHREQRSRFFQSSTTAKAAKLPWVADGLGSDFSAVDYAETKFIRGDLIIRGAPVPGLAMSVQKGRSR